VAPRHGDRGVGAGDVHGRRRAHDRAARQAHRVARGARGGGAADEPDYLVSTDLVGPTLTAAASASVPNVARWDENFRSWGDHHWTQTGDGWGGQLLRPRQQLLRDVGADGNPAFWLRGTRLAVAYRRDYVEANNGSSPHWAQIAASSGTTS
jgi:hypothetical protein